MVEHDEAMIRAADHVIEIGPEPGARGGHVVFEGTVARMLQDAQSITGAYFSGRRRIAARRRAPAGRRRDPRSWRFDGTAKHNLHDLSVRIPLRRFVCLSGVSGSGKSTLLDNVIYQGLLAHRGLAAEDPAAYRADPGRRGDLRGRPGRPGPVSRTPRSNPALYVEAWDLIRELFAATPAAQAAAMSAVELLLQQRRRPLRPLPRARL